MKNVIDVIFFNVEAGLKPNVIKLDVEDIEAIKTIIGCRAIDKVRCVIGGKEYCVVCENQVFLKEKISTLAIYSRDLYKRIYGNIIIACQDRNKLSSVSNIDKVRIDVSLGTLTTDITRYVLVAR